MTEIKIETHVSMEKLAELIIMAFTPQEIWDLICEIDQRIDEDLIKAIHQASDDFLTDESGVQTVGKLEDTVLELQADLEEAERLIAALQGAPPPRIWKKWPKLTEKANKFLHRNDEETNEQKEKSEANRG
jgi:hypothetical protein